MGGPSSDAYSGALGRSVEFSEFQFPFLNQDSQFYLSIGKD